MWYMRFQTNVVKNIYVNFHCSWNNLQLFAGLKLYFNLFYIAIICHYSGLNIAKFRTSFSLFKACWHRTELEYKVTAFKSQSFLCNCFWNSLQLWCWFKVIYHQLLKSVTCLPSGLNNVMFSRSRSRQFKACLLAALFRFHLTL